MHPEALNFLCTKAVALLENPGQYLREQLYLHPVANLILIEDYID